MRFVANRRQRIRILFENRTIKSVERTLSCVHWRFSSIISDFPCAVCKRYGCFGQPSFSLFVGVCACGVGCVALEYHGVRRKNDRELQST